jgi:hypothetical protein
MKNILLQIGIRLYALRYVPEYRHKILAKGSAIIVLVLIILCIHETVIY